MDIDKLILFVSGLGALVVVVFGFALLVAKFYRKVEQGRALIINKVTKRPDVTFTGGLVLPIIHRAEEMDISVKTIEVDRRGKEGLICHDNIRADIKVTFFVKVNRKEESVLKVAQQVGCKRASDQATIEELFMAKFSEAVKTVGKGLDFVELYTNRDGFRDAIRAHIGNEEDLNGYILDDVAIDFLEQTPIESLDPENILDAQGIRKITELTTAQNIQTNNFRQDERKAIKKKNVEAEEALLELNRQEADAKAKQQREIDVMVAREKATTEVEQAEQFQRARRARIKAEEDVEVAEQDKARQVEIAEKARERAIAIENERVEKDRALEAISREREVELQTINKDKEVEVEKKNIADVVRSRIAVERTVAEEEENIKDLRATSEANRNKDVAVTAAEAEAEEGLVKEIKAAEAKQEVAKFSAREQLTLADAELEAADRQAKAKIRLAEGTQAEEAAEGLARVRVRESEALAIEKEGQANAQVVQLKMEAEAAGLRQKAEAMEALRGAAKDHEEFRLRLETDRDIRFKRMETEQVIARDRAEILKDAFEQAKINIVGGDGRFFDKFINAIAVGQSVDGTLDNSETIRKLMDGYLEGDGNLPKDVLTALNGGGASNVQALTISAFLTQLMGSADEPMKEKLRKLMAEAQALGIGAGHGDGAN
ncbi:MAG: flotillin family protein [Myxococcota bacterium]